MEKSIVEDTSTKIPEVGVIDKILAFVKSFSLRPVVFSTSCCSHEIELAFSASYSTDKLGFTEVTDDFLKGDVYIIAGILNEKFVRMIKECYYSSPSPKYIVALGGCSIAGDIFEHQSNKMKLDAVIPVDVYIPGCPPSPEEIIYGLRMLQKKIRGGYVRKRAPSRDAYKKLSYDVSTVIKHGFSIETECLGKELKNLRLDTEFSTRGIEAKIVGANILSALTYISKLDQYAPVAPELLFVEYLQKALNTPAPRQVELYQVTLIELMRISSHLTNMSKLAKHFNRMSLYTQITVFSEKIRDLLGSFAGKRTYSPHFLPGSMKSQATPSFLRDLKDVLKRLSVVLKHFERQIFHKALVVKQIDKLGYVSKNQALEYKLSGPNLRAAGVNIDCRKTNSLYKELGFKPILGRDGMAKDRFQVRFQEIIQSILIINRAVKLISQGSDKSDPFDYAKLDSLTCNNDTLAIESPRGELEMTFGLNNGVVSHFNINNPSSNVVGMINKTFVDVDFEMLDLYLMSFDIDVVGVDK